VRRAEADPAAPANLVRRAEADPAALANLVRMACQYGPNYSRDVAATALNKINDEAVICDLYLTLEYHGEHELKEAFHTAISTKITDQYILAKIIDGRNDECLDTACSRIIDQNILYGLIINDKKSYNRRSTASGYLTDPKLQARAVEKLTLEIQGESHPEESTTNTILCPLINNMTDLGVLGKLLCTGGVRKDVLLNVTRRLAQLGVQGSDLPDNSAIIYDVISRESAPFSPTPQYQALDIYSKIRWLVTEAFKWGGRYGFPWPYTFYPQYSELRRLGEELHSRGGLASMQRAAQQVGSRQQPLLSHIWDGVGDWMH
jgi:hypothetical protein